MDGFVGIVGQDVNQSLFEEMTNLMGNRGPHGHLFYVDQHFQLGFHRLNTNDLERKEHYLTYADERYIIVFNGKIYNNNELKERLISLKYPLKTCSEAEMIVALYRKIGKNVVNHLNGMFAFVIWDKIERKLFAARDHFGMKPIYYTNKNDQFIIASDSKVIWHYLKNVALNEESLQHYLTFQYVPEPNTAFENVYKLESGMYCIKKGEKECEIRKYWEPTFQPARRNMDELKAMILNSLRDSVHEHLESDVPVGSFLSSGIDSTTIVALAKEIKPDLKTFTVGFERDGFNEITIAKETAEYLGVRNIHYTITPEEYLNELPKIIWHMDEPIADPSAIPLYFASRMASEHVKIVLSGEGADELFGGYGIYREPHSLKFFSFLPASLKNLLRWMAHFLPNQMKGKSFIERGTTPIEKRFIGNAKIMLEEEKSLLLKNYDPKKPYSVVTAPIYERCKAYDDVLKMQYVDIHTWLRGDILAKAEKMSMANSIDLRLPFLDQRVFSVAKKLTTSTKISRKNTKVILRQAVKDIVPDQIYKRKKLGFPVPIRYWLKNEWYDWVVKTIKESETDYLFHKNYIFDLLERHCLGKEDNSRKLWVILTFMVWHQIFVEGLHEDVRDGEFVGIGGFEDLK